MAAESPVVKLKMELEEEPSLLVRHGNHLASPNTRVPSLPLWKMPQGTRLQQVEVEEQSVKIALPQLLELKSRLSKYADSVPSVNRRIEIIDAILSRKRKCRITAGAVGPTGMGKSTVWNAVLGFRELLPTDNGQACTSAIIEVLWNPSEDPAAIFQAKIVFLQARDWQAEVEQLYTDVEALARKDAGDDDGLDVELETRIDAVMEKVRAVYPFIDNKQDLKRMTAEKLMNHENVNNLGKELVFNGTDLHKFASQIREFLVSSVGGGNFAPWPLVKIAQIFVKAEILRDGLVLVDIPGNMDTNAARNSLAQNYQKELSVNCILSASKRAASDQTAQIALNATYQRHLQLDGHWKADRIIFIVVRTDESITVEDHIAKNPEVTKSLGPIFEQERNWTSRKCALENEINEVEASIAKKTKVVTTLNKELRRLWTWLKNDSEFKGIPLGVKRKGGSELLKAVMALNSLSETDKVNAEKLMKLRKDRADTRKLQSNEYRVKSGKQSELKEVERRLVKVKCIKTRACIEHRSWMQTAKIREYFDRISRETGNGPDSRPLPVVCVSASKYLDFVDKSPPSLGFPTPVTTQIPQLRKALLATTLGVRHRNAKATLEEIEAVVNSIQSWAKSLDSCYQMSPKQRKDLEDKFEGDVNTTLESFSQLHVTTTDAMTKVIRSGIFSKLRPIQSKASSTAPDTADKWAVKIHWGTYRATVGNLGEFRSTTRKEPFSWNEDLAGNYIDPMIPSWTELFETKLPGLRCQNNETAKKLLLQLSETVTSSAEVICPQIKEPLKSLKENIVQLQPVVEELYALIWDVNISAARSSIHQLLKPQILKSMTATFKKAARERGKGFKVRIETILRNHLKSNALPMYKESTVMLICALDRMVSKLRDDLDVTPDDLIVQTRDLFKSVLDNHKPTDAITLKGLSAIKCKLLNDVTSVVDSLNASLEHYIQIPMEEVEEQTPSYEVDELAGRTGGDGSDLDDDDGGSMDMDLDDDDAVEMDE